MSRSRSPIVYLPAGTYVEQREEPVIPPRLAKRLILNPPTGLIPAQVQNFYITLHYGACQLAHCVFAEKCTACLGYPKPRSTPVIAAQPSPAGNRNPIPKPQSVPPAGHGSQRPQNLMPGNHKSAMNGNRGLSKTTKPLPRNGLKSHPEKPVTINGICAKPLDPDRAVAKMVEHIGVPDGLLGKNGFISHIDGPMAKTSFKGFPDGPGMFRGMPCGLGLGPVVNDFGIKFNPAAADCPVIPLGAENVAPDPEAVDKAMRERMKRDEERENVLGVQSSHPYYDRELLYPLGAPVGHRLN